MVYESVEIVFIPKITLHACNGKDINYFLTFMFCTMCYSLIITSPINWIFSSIMILEFFLPKIIPLHVIKQNDNKELKMKILNHNKILLISQMRTLQIYCTYKNSFEQKISIFPYYVRKIKYFANKDLLMLICDDQRFKISLVYLTVRNLKILKVQDINDINYQSRIKVQSENLLVYSYQDSIFNYNLKNSQSQRLFQCAKIIFYKIYNNDIIVLSQKGKPTSPIDIHCLGSKYSIYTNQFKDKLLNHLIVDKDSLQYLLIQHSQKNMALKLQQNSENDNINNPKETINPSVYGIIKDYKSNRFAKLQLQNV
ncbi:hypothetical protein ABPG72_020594 [Tetrahymena utriculariae]